jgi:hypothetical protein
MARVAPLAPRRTSRLDPIPIAWGGLVASIGLMAGSSRDWPLRLTAAAASFGLGGFLAGVRADSRRPAHALAAAVCGYAIHAVFIAIARLIDALGGPDAPQIAPGSGRDWVVAAGWAALFALAGGALAGAWLSPGARR